jgi:hypothetical protein
MKKQVKYLLLLLMTALYMPIEIDAQAGNPLGTISPPSSQRVDLNTVIFNLINIAILGSSLVFLAVFVWACIEWITSEGDKGRLAQARSRMTAGAVGLIIVGGSWAIWMVVRKITIQ